MKKANYYVLSWISEEKYSCVFWRIWGRVDEVIKSKLRELYFEDDLGEIRILHYYSIKKSKTLLPKIWEALTGKGTEISGNIEGYPLLFKGKDSLEFFFKMKGISTYKVEFS